MTAGNLDSLRYKDENIDSSRKKMFDFRSIDYSEEITKKKIVEETSNNQSSENQEYKKENTTKEEDSKKESSGQKSKDFEDVFDASNYDEVSEFAIELIDLGMSSIGKFISKEKGSSHKFEAPPHKKAKLSRQLSKILNKHKFAISIEFIFIVSLIMIYAGPIREAIKLRAENTEKEKQKAQKEEEAERRRQDSNNSNSQNNNNQNNNQSSSVIEDAKIIEETPRKSGRPSKEEQERKRKARQEEDNK